MIKPLTLFALVFFLFLPLSAAVACTCVTLDQKIPNKQMKANYLNTFKGSVFTGKVVNIEVETIVDPYGSDGSTEHYSARFKKVTIRVERYWLNVDKPEVTIYTGMGGGDCGVDFQVDHSYFFSPQLMNTRLMSGYCEYDSADSMRADGVSVKRFEKLFGKGKTFKND